MLGKGGGVRLSVGVQGLVKVGGVGDRLGKGGEVRLSVGVQGLVKVEGVGGVSSFTIVIVR